MTPNSVLTSSQQLQTDPPSTLILKTRQAAAFARLHLEKHGDMPKIWWKIYSMEKPFNGKKDMRKKRSIFFREVWRLEVVRMIPSKTLQSKSSGFMWPYEGCRVQSLLKCLLATFISDHLDILGTTLTSDTPEVNSSPLKSYDPKRRVTFQPLFFRSYVKLPGSTSFKLPSDSKPLTTSWHQAIVASWVWKPLGDSMSYSISCTKIPIAWSSSSHSTAWSTGSSPAWGNQESMIGVSRRLLGFSFFWGGFISLRIHKISHHITSYHTIQYHIISYHTIQYHTILYHIIPYSLSHPCVVSRKKFRSKK